MAYITRHLKCRLLAYITRHLKCRLLAYITRHLKCRLLAYITRHLMCRLLAYITRHLMCRLLAYITRHLMCRLLAYITSHLMYISLNIDQITDFISNMSNKHPLPQILIKHKKGVFNKIFRNRAFVFFFISMTWLTTTVFLYNNWSRICSVCRNHNSVSFLIGDLSPGM